MFSNFVMARTFKDNVLFIRNTKPGAMTIAAKTAETEDVQAG